MPDIDFQKIVLNLIPKQGEQPVVFYASQYETTRSFIAELMWGDSEFAPGHDHWAEIDIRKNDDNLVVITDDVTINNNEVSVILPVQAVTCIGKNLGQIKIYSGEDQFVAAFNFILEVQPDPLAGGVTSDTAIDNLTQQIEDIAQEVIGDDYYNKTQTDALLANKANISDLPDMSNYYNKTEADALLSDKLNDYQLDDTPVLGSVSAAQIVSGWDSQHGSYKLIKNVALNTYSKSEIDTIIDNIFPTLTASGPIASFSTALNKPLVSVTADPGATTITRCGVNLFDDAYVDNNLTAEQILPAGTYYINAFVTGSSEQNRRFSIYFNDTWNVIDSAGTFDDGGITWSGSTFGWLYGNATATVTLTKPYKLRASVLVDTYQVRRYAIYDDNSITQFIDYNGQTVPVADATTLTTLSGVNNVFANSGDVTVQYKYMSM